jgi:hypothetical protein
MAHLAEVFSFRDAAYTTLHEARKQMDRGCVLRARITTDAATRIVPKTKAPWRQQPPPPRVPLYYRQVVHPVALIQDSSSIQRSLSPIPPAQALPGYSSKSGDKGKRGPPQLANRRQPPQKLARSDPDPPPTRASHSDRQLVYSCTAAGVPLTLTSKSVAN